MLQNGLRAGQEDLMSVYRQLIAVISGVIIVLTSLWMLVNIYADRTLMIQQVETRAQSGATALAISITEVLASKNSRRLDTLFNAVADLGDYEKIYFHDLRGDPVIRRGFSAAKPAVPDLFMQLIALPSVERTAIVSSGWTKLGDAGVVINNQRPYETLWASALHTFKWGGALAFLGISLSILFIHGRLRAAQRYRVR
jgi:hypothetical protein